MVLSGEYIAKVSVHGDRYQNILVMLVFCAKIAWFMHQMKMDIDRKSHYVPPKYFTSNNFSSARTHVPALVIILDQEKGQGGMEKGQGGRSALSLYQTTKF